MTLFTTASFVQEHLIKLPLNPSCLGQGYILPHTCRPGKLWWAGHSQSKGCWKRSLYPGSGDFLPLVYIRIMLQLCISRVSTLIPFLGITLLFSFCDRPWGEETCRQLMDGYLAPRQCLALHNGFDNLNLSHTRQELCQKLGSDHMWQQMLPVRVVGTWVCYCQAHSVLQMHWLVKMCRRSSILPWLISGLGKLWKTSSPLFFKSQCTWNILRTFFKDTGFKKHYAELLKMQSYLCLKAARFQEGWNRNPQGWIFLGTII